MLRTALLALALAFALATVAPAASPVQVSYVVSDSMEPTLDTNDGYVLVPAGPVEEGDVVTFYSERRGTYVTHRVVGTIPDGYLTRGDANPSTDQAAGSPPVARESIVGEVLTVGGRLVVLPRLGVALGALRTHWLWLAALAGVALAARGLGPDVTAGDRPRADRSRAASVVRGRRIVVPALLTAVVVSTGMIAAGATHAEFTYTVTDDGTEASQTLRVGEPTTVSLNATVASTPLTRTVVATDGLRLVDVTTDGPDVDRTGGAATVRPPPDRGGSALGRFVETSETRLTAEVPAQTSPGTHTTRVSLAPYPATLPAGMLASLHAVSPLLTALVSVLVVFGPGYALYWLFVDTAAPIRRPRRRVVRRWWDDDR